MTRHGGSAAGQLGFDTLLTNSDIANRQRHVDRETAHLPATMDEALPFYRALIDRHHQAMLTGELARAMQMREEAHNLALRLNRGEPGIIADDESPGCVLERETAAPAGAMPLWGQRGDFIIAAAGMSARIAIDGMFGICTLYFPCPGFALHAVEFDRPFLSETGYRSFRGIPAHIPPGFAPDAFVRVIIEAYVNRDLKGKLVAIEKRYRRDTGR